MILCCGPLRTTTGITSATHNGAVYLLHAVSETNTAILPDVIDYWLDNGYTVKSISG